MVDILLIKNNLFKGLEALLRLHALCYLEVNMLAIPVFISLEACFVTLPTLSFLESLLLIRPEFSHLRTFSRIPGISLLAGYLRQRSFVFLELILFGLPMLFLLPNLLHREDFWVLKGLPLFVLMAWLQFNLGKLVSIKVKWTVGCFTAMLKKFKTYAMTISIHVRRLYVMFLVSNYGSFKCWIK